MSPKSPHHGKSVLITGGAGFIGSALAKKLFREGAQVAITSRSKAPWRLRGNDGIAVHVVDLRERESVEKLLHEVQPDSVFNLASSPVHDQVLDEVRARIEATFGITQNVVLASVAAGVKRIVHLGTIEEYGGCNVVADESMRESPISPYSLGKTMATHFVLTAGRLSGTEVCVVRPAATYGPGQGLGMLMPNLIEASILRRDFDMNKGEQLRDFVFIDDLVDGIALAGIHEQSPGHIFNMGGLQPVSIRDVVSTVLERVSSPVTVNFGVRPYRPQDPMTLALDSRKAGDLLGWKPQTPLSSGVMQTVQWYEEHYHDVKGFLHEKK